MKCDKGKGVRKASLLDPTICMSRTGPSGGGECPGVGSLSLDRAMFETGHLTTKFIYRGLLETNACGFSMSDSTFANLSNAFTLGNGTFLIRNTATNW